MRATSLRCEYLTNPMGIDEKIRNATEKVTGAAKEKWGEMTDDEERDGYGRVGSWRGDGL